MITAELSPLLNEKVEKLSCVSLFSGSGGLDCGFRLYNMFDTRLAIDVNDSAARAFCLNFGMEIQDEATDEKTDTCQNRFWNRDITKVNFESKFATSINPDVIIGGPPCQDFSVIRGPKGGDGMKVQRGRLYSYFVKSLIHLKPKYFVFENVPGLKGEKHGETWNTIKEDFSNLTEHAQEIKQLTGNGYSNTNPGYHLIFSDIVDASRLGVAQKRSRAIIIGIRKDLLNGTLPQKELLKRIATKELSGVSLFFSKFPLTPIEVIEGYPLPELREKYREIMDDWRTELGKSHLAKPKNWVKNFEAEYTGDILLDYIKANVIQEVIPNEMEIAFKEHKKLLIELGYYGKPAYELTYPDGSNDIPKDSDFVNRRMKLIPPDENYKFLYRYLRYRVEGKGISMIYRRIHPLKPSYTVVAKGGGGTHGYHYLIGRSRLTNRERARLQSFPESFLFDGGYSEQRSQVGEAVPPLLGRRIGEVLVKINEIIECESSNLT